MTEALAELRRALDAALPTGITVRSMNLDDMGNELVVHFALPAPKPDICISSGGLKIEDHIPAICSVLVRRVTLYNQIGW